jgi:hypothetical protein
LWSTVTGSQVKEFSRRKKLFGGEKEQLLQVIVNVGTFYSLNVPAERRSDVDALVAEVPQSRSKGRVTPGEGWRRGSRSRR